MDCRFAVQGCMLLLDRPSQQDAHARPSLSRRGARDTLEVVNLNLRTMPMLIAASNAQSISETTDQHINTVQTNVGELPLSERNG